MVQEKVKGESVSRSHPPARSRRTRPAGPTSRPRRSSSCPSPSETPPSRTGSAASRPPARSPGPVTGSSVSWNIGTRVPRTGTLPGVAAGELVRGSPTPEGPAEDHPSVRALRERFGEAVGRTRFDAIHVPVVVVDPDRVGDVLAVPARRRISVLRAPADVMGADLGGGRPLEVWYQLWSNCATGAVPRRGRAAVDDLSVPSATGLWQTANWLEREVYDLFGVTFERTPRPPANPHAGELRRGLPAAEGFPAAGAVRSGGAGAAGARARGSRTCTRYESSRWSRVSPARIGEVEAAGRATRIDVPHDGSRRMRRGPRGRADAHQHGPQHPATHGVLRLVLQLDGETRRAAASPTWATCTPGSRRRASTASGTRSSRTRTAWTTWRR